MRFAMLPEADSSELVMRAANLNTKESQHLINSILRVNRPNYSCFVRPNNCTLPAITAKKLSLNIRDGGGRRNLLTPLLDSR